MGKMADTVNGADLAGFIFTTDGQVWSAWQAQNTRNTPRPRGFIQTVQCAGARTDRARVASVARQVFGAGGFARPATEHHTGGECLGWAIYR